jgi:hypothetical protein
MIDGAKLYEESLGNPGTNYIVIAMFTADLRGSADRLLRSVKKFNLNHSFYQVPTVHKGISIKGSNDIAFCKPNFIRAALDHFRKPVLYVDADVIFKQSPVKIAEVSNSGVDFAIYNWLADASTDAYVPVKIKNKPPKGFYRFSHSIDWLDDSQLLCSGAVQYYDNSAGARRMLETWLASIKRFPEVVDDELLDYSFNFELSEPISTYWLGKEFCRYAFWILTQPIIDHPDMPAFDADERRFFKFASGGRDRFRQTKNGPRALPPFPRDCIIDTKNKTVLVNVGGQLVPRYKFDMELWI